MHAYDIFQIEFTNKAKSEEEDSKKKIQCPNFRLRAPDWGIEFYAEVHNGIRKRNAKKLELIIYHVEVCRLIFIYQSDSVPGDPFHAHTSTNMYKSLEKLLFFLSRSFVRFNLLLVRC